MEEGLAREFGEESGAAVRVERLLWSEECFWEWNGRQAHSIAFYYRVEETGGIAIPDTGDFVPHKDNSNVVMGWLTPEELRDVTIYPEFLKEQIHELYGPVKHFVSR